MILLSCAATRPARRPPVAFGCARVSFRQNLDLALGFGFLLSL